MSPAKTQATATPAITIVTRRAFEDRSCVSAHIRFGIAFMCAVAVDAWLPCREQNPVTWRSASAGVVSEKTCSLDDVLGLDLRYVSFAAHLGLIALRSCDDSIDGQV